MKVLTENYSDRCPGYSSPSWLRHSNDGRYVLMADGDDVIHLDMGDFSWRQVRCLEEPTLNCGVPCDDGGLWLLYNFPNLLVRTDAAGLVRNVLPVETGAFLWGGTLPDGDDWLVVLPSVSVSRTEMALKVFKGGEHCSLKVSEPEPCNVWYHDGEFRYLTIDEKGLECWQFGFGKEAYLVSRLPAGKITAFSADHQNIGEYQRYTAGWSAAGVQYIRYANWCVEVTGDGEIRNVPNAPVVCFGHCSSPLLRTKSLIAANRGGLGRPRFPGLSPFLLGCVEQNGGVTVATTRGITCFEGVSEEALSELIGERIEQARLDADALAMLLQYEYPEEQVYWDTFSLMVGAAFVQNESAEYARLVEMVEKKLQSSRRFASKFEERITSVLELNDEQLFTKTMVSWLYGLVLAAARSVVLQDYYAGILNRVLRGEGENARLRELLRIFLDIKPTEQSAWLRSKIRGALPDRDTVGIRLAGCPEAIELLNELEHPEAWVEWIARAIENHPSDRKVAEVVVRVLKEHESLVYEPRIRRSLSVLANDHAMAGSIHNTVLDLWMDAGLRSEWLLGGDTPLQRRLTRLVESGEGFFCRLFLMQQCHSQPKLVGRLLRSLIIEQATLACDLRPLLCLSAWPSTPGDWMDLGIEEGMLFKIAGVAPSDTAEDQAVKLWTHYGQKAGGAFRWALAMNLLRQWPVKPYAAGCEGDAPSGISPAACLLNRTVRPEKPIRKELHDVACGGPDDPRWRRFVRRVIDFQRLRKTPFGQWLLAADIEIK